MTPSDKNQNIIWIDCEMTGLSIERDALVEIGVLVTDSDLNILGDGVSVVIAATSTQLEPMSDFLRKMHADSGLLAEIPHGKSTVEAEEIVLSYLRQHCEPGKQRNLERIKADYARFLSA